MAENIKEEPSPLLKFLARRFAGLDDKQMGLLPPDRWVFSNLRGALNETPGASRNFDRIWSSVAMAGICALAAGATLALAGMAALPLAGACLAASAAASWRVHTSFLNFKRQSLPGIGKSMGKRFLLFQGETVRDKWRDNLEKARARRQAPEAPASVRETSLTASFSQPPAKQDQTPPPAPPAAPQP